MLGLPLKVISFCGGTLAVVLNLAVLLKLGQMLRVAQSLAGEMNKISIMTISLGDLFMGVYLVGIAAVNQYYGSSYCTVKYEWLTSIIGCMSLGVLSTFASHTSLLSMAALSFLRMVNLGALAPLEGNSPKAIAQVRQNYTRVYVKIVPSQSYHHVMLRF